LPPAKSEQPFVRLLEIVHVVPCLADPSKIRFTAQFDSNVASVFPYLNAILQGAIYNDRGKTLTLRRDGRLITLHPDRVSASKINDIDDARAVVSWLVGLINECDRKRATIQPNYDRRDQLRVIDVVKLLPGTNCRACGLTTCLAFAAQIASEKASIMACSELFLAEYRDKREELLNLLRAGGYTVPDGF